MVEQVASINTVNKGEIGKLKYYYCIQTKKKVYRSCAMEMITFLVVKTLIILINMLRVCWPLSISIDSVYEFYTNKINIPTKIRVQKIVKQSTNCIPLYDGGVCIANDFCYKLNMFLFFTLLIISMHEK